MLTEGMAAPELFLEDQDGKMRSLKDWAGKRLVVYFYSKDNTAGCTAQAAGYRDLWPQFTEKGVHVVGISRDSATSHKRFADKYALPFTLLSDPESEAARAYGVWQEKNMYGKKVMGVVRSSFLIDENGIVRGVYRKVKGADNAAAMLEELD